MSEDIKTALCQEVKQIEDKHTANPEKAATWAIKEYIREIAHVMARAKEHLDDESFSNFLHETGISPKDAKELVEDLARERYFATVIEPLHQRHLAILDQIIRIGKLRCEEDKPHYAKMMASLRKEMYEIAKEIDEASIVYEAKDEARGLPSLPSLIEMTDEFFGHMRRLAEDEEYRREVLSEYEEQPEEED